MKFDGVLHVNATPEGFHEHTALQGEVDIVPDDPTLPVYIGHFAMDDGMNLTRQTDTATFTFSGQATAADASTIRWSAVIHTTLLPDGTVSVQFERFREVDSPGGRCTA